MGRGLKRCFAFGNRIGNRLPLVAEAAFLKHNFFSYLCALFPLGASWCLMICFAVASLPISPW